MSEQKHTPGRWAWCGDPGQPDIGYDISESHYGGKVCEIGTVGGRWVKEGLANAWLISAAPDLLAACKRLLAVIDGTTGHDFTMPADADDAAAAALSAIAKAEQGTNGVSR